MHEYKRMASLVEAKADAEEGSIRCVFSTFNVVDRDNEIVMASAFTPNQPIAMVWSHDWNRPVGRGTIEVEPDRAIFDGKFFMDTSAGLDAFRTCRAMGDLQEYSWGFRVIDSKFEEREGTPVRVITKAEIFEVSPVLIGAGLNTHTIAMKADQLQQTFSDEADAALTAVTGLANRLRSLGELRRKEGRAISTARRTQMAGIAESLREAAGSIDAILKETEPAPAAPKQQAGLAEAIRFTLAGIP